MEMDSRIELTPRFLWGVGSAILLAVGSLGPWVTLGPFSASGTSDGRDGLITLVIALAAAVLICVRRVPWLVVILALVALYVGIHDTNNVSTAGNEVLDPEVGWGLVLVDIAAASLFLWGLVAVGVKRRLRHVDSEVTPQELNVG
jgi:hypothetical protein